MRARDLAVELPTVKAHDPVAKAVRLLEQHQLPGLVVVDQAGHPRTVLPGTQVLRMAVLQTYQQEPLLARTIDEAHADIFWQELDDRTVNDCMPQQGTKPVKAGMDATLLELATLMARARSPLIAIVDHDGMLVGGVTLNRLLTSLALPESTD